MPLPQHTQTANNRRPQFVRAATAASPGDRSMSMVDHKKMNTLTKAELKGMFDQVMACKDPPGYVKCVMKNYVISEIGMSRELHDCSSYCPSSDAATYK